MSEITGYNMWPTGALKDFALIKYGKSKPQIDGAVPVVGSGGIYGFTSEPLVDYPTLIVGRKGTAGKVWIQENGCWPSDTTFFLDWKDNPIDIWFLYHYLTANPLSGEHAKTTLPSLQKQDLENVEIPLPPLPEQKAIAGALRAVQEAKEATERVIAAARELKASLMRHLFTFGPVPFDEADRVNLKETEIGPVPEEWNLISFEDVADIKSGQVDPREKPYSALFHVGPEHIEALTGRLINLQTAEEAKLISGKYHFTNEDVLYSKIRPYLQKVAIPDFEGICSADMYPIRVKSNCVKEYLYFWLLSQPFTKQAISYQNRTGIPKINRQQLNSTLIPLPDFDTQKEISTMLRSVEEKENRETSKRDTLNVLFDSLLHNLMTGQVRVPENREVVE